MSQFDALAQPLCMVASAVQRRVLVVSQWHPGEPRWLSYLKRIAVALTLATLVCRTTWADNVDLSTVPKRNTVQLTIYNSEDLTLVRETRVVTFKKGSNPLQFSWANTKIDPSSVELKFLTTTDKLDVLDTTFPHDKLQMLYWNVKSEFDGEATIQITYFTSGITWSADYTAIADKEENKLEIDGFVKITNNSGEEYEDAQVRLVVGTINLVEKIAELAQLPVGKDENSNNYNRAKQELAKRAMGVFDGSGDKLGSSMPTSVVEEKKLIKEGLSEYFIYTLEGTETIPIGWSKRMRSFRGEDVPIQIQYRYRPREYGDQLVRMYLLSNSKASKLGTTPLPDGMVRVFRNNGRDGLSFLTQQAIKYIPIGDKVELNLGHDPEVVFELTKERVSRDDIWMQVNGKNEFQSVGNDATELEVHSSVVGWNERRLYCQQIRNYTAKPIQVEIRRGFEGHNDFSSSFSAKLYDFQTVEFNAQVAAGEKKEMRYEVVRHQGRNAKQNNVTIVQAVSE